MATIPHHDYEYVVTNDDWNDAADVVNGLGDKSDELSDDVSTLTDAVNATAPIKALTQTEYDALSTSEKNNGTVYLIQGGGIAYNGTRYASAVQETTIESNSRHHIVFYEGTGVNNFVAALIFTRVTNNARLIALFAIGFGYGSARLSVSQIYKGVNISYEVDDENLGMYIDLNASRGSSSEKLCVYMFYGDYPEVTIEAIE